MSVVKTCTFDICRRRLALGLFARSPVRALASGRGHGRWDNFLGNLTRGRRRASDRKRSFTSILELESFVQVKELSSKCKMACLGEIDRAEPLGERQESFEEGKGDVDVESDEESWHSFDEDCTLMAVSCLCVEWYKTKSIGGCDCNVW